MSTETVDAAKPPLLTLDQIYGSSDLETLDVFVPEWQGTIRFRQLSATEGMQLGKAIEGAKQGSNLKILQFCCVTPDGTKLFHDPRLIEKLAAKNLKVVNRLANEASVFLGLSLTPPATAKQLLMEIKSKVLEVDGSVSPGFSVQDVLTMCEEFVKEDPGVKNA